MQTILINGNDSRTFGIVFTASAMNALLTPPPLKAGISNKSRAEHGKRVVATATKYDERDVTLELYLYASGWAQFAQRRAAMMTLLTAASGLSVVIDDEPTTVYRLHYVSCTQFTQFNGRLAKFQIKMNEANPNNRQEA